MSVLETERLFLSELSVDNDAEFIFSLLNEPTFKQFIGDKAIGDLGDARDYIYEKAVRHYEQHGFGLYRVARRQRRDPIGICGLVKRGEFAHPDLGFAFLKAHWSKGYAYEASCAVLEHAQEVLGFDRVLAMADEDNHASTKLLERLGFRFENKVTMPGESVEISQYAIEG